MAFGKMPYPLLLIIEIIKRSHTLKSITPNIHLSVNAEYSLFNVITGRMTRSPNDAKMTICQMPHPLFLIKDINNAST
jgi:hypothetical protein